jgi:membrane peptidoglycan carboxypeptidase
VSRKSLTRLLLIGLAATAVGALVALIVDEVQTSRLQARLLSRLGGELQHTVEPGPSKSIRFPGDGPYDARMGYHQLPGLIEKLSAQQFDVSAQARMSARQIALRDQGLFAIYREKDQAGLTLRDCRNEPLYSARYPKRVYDRYESVPPLLVASLLFIENRELLDAERPSMNPAVEWVRLGKAVAEQALRLVGDDHRTPGGSTLATQLEKYRHSPDGRTDSATEKLRQMASASLRAYLDGENTLPRRREIVVNYLNTVPLAARPAWGEVNGVGDGLWAWYGRDFEEVTALLKQADDTAASDAFEQRRRKATAFKQALSLMVAQRRPSHYLGTGNEGALTELTNSYLRVMAEAGVIAPALRDAALAAPLKRLPNPPRESVAPFTERKASTALRSRLSNLLGVPRAYDLDRFDLTVGSTLDGETQQALTRTLVSLREPEAARAAGLYGHHLLKPGDDPSKLQFSFTLYERGERANLLRAQTDNVDQPFDINEGARLDLGSTSKLRTLVTYLELLADLHERWSALDRKELAAVTVIDNDNLARWGREYLLNATDRSLAAMLEAAMLRSYSADTSEGFFTGGGLHHFVNFDPEDNFRVLTVRESFRRSVNLPFIRMMRDIVRHTLAKTPGAALLSNPADPARREYLARFADREGSQFLTAFHRKYRDQTREQAEDLLLRDLRVTPKRLAAVFGVLEPNGGVDALAAFLAARLPGTRLTPAAIQSLHDQYGGQRMSLEDQGYVAGIHPLELWLVGHLRQHPGARLPAVLAASEDERQTVYGWIFRTRHKQAQDVRIRQSLELEAFIEIARSWKRLGYPFESLTPSYASALGASGDRPAALAELMGIIVNQGMRLPASRIESLAFAADTPYETRLTRRASAGERVLPVEVTQTVRRALIDVVANGTAGRLRGSLVRSDASVVEIGGKTGTGDHRYDVYGPRGQLISTRVVNRTATFVFLIGERYFGTVMVYAHAPYAENYKFTSALPSQLLKSLVPMLRPLVDNDACSSAADDAALRASARVSR